MPSHDLQYSTHRIIRRRVDDLLCLRRHRPDPVEKRRDGNARGNERFGGRFRNDDFQRGTGRRSHRERSITILSCSDSYCPQGEGGYRFALETGSV